MIEKRLVIGTDIAPGTVVASNIANGTITGAKLVNDTLSNTQVGLAASASFAPANPTGTTSTAAYLMMGLGSTIAFTPAKTGIIKVTLSALGVNNTAADGFSAKLAYGTGTAPANAAAASGTIEGNTVTISNGTVVSSFSIVAIVTGLTVGTAIWGDLQLEAITGGTASITNVACVIEELLA